MVDTCGCRKGAMRPGCPRHDPMRRLTPIGRYKAAFMRSVDALVARFEAHRAR